MSELAENTLHPLQIADARDACFRASELQRDCEDRLRLKSKTLADAERQFRRLLSRRILELHAGGLAVTTCEGIAKGEDEVSDLRHIRDVAKGEYEAVEQECFRRGADRRDTNQLLQWSQQRDLRTDAEPNWGGQPITGGSGLEAVA